jgi:putative colanic acid biosynthesis UDP-glucose lipid carrier transferase
MYNSNPIAMEPNKPKTRKEFRYLYKTNNKKVKVFDLIDEPNALLDRYKRSITLSKGNSLTRIGEVQQNYLQNAYWGAGKRFFDLVISTSVVVFVLSWMYPLLLILIKLESRGPIIFKQKRNGLNQNHFDCYKFRSMEINDYCDSVPTIYKDPRITKVGRFMRKYSIDELPQFINVLKGDMTVVGPRPHMLSETDTFNKISQDFYKRHLVKPGITGLAQINNSRGEINSINDLSSRIKYDLFYIKNASMGYDFKIVYWTFIKMIFGDPKAK